MDCAGTDERRTAPDRRETPTSVWDATFFRGERRHVRRACDRLGRQIVDRFSLAMFLPILVLLACALVDGFLTLELIEAGYHEANPVMHVLLARGPVHFLIGKYVLAAAGLPLLVLFGTHSRVRYLVPIFAALYVLLITYQVILLWQLQ
jgi:Domain of unknown function (DUF5658)